MIYRGVMAVGWFQTWVNARELDGAGFWCLFFGCMLAVMLVSYLLGSLNFAIILSRLRYHEDVRTQGSGNAGMTNMLRTYGKGSAALTLLGDMGKSVVSVTLGCALLGVTFGGYLAAFFCMLGHMFPVFYRFRGGKGVAVTAAAILVLNPLVFAMVLFVFIVIVAATKYVSLGSVMAALLYPILLNRMDSIFTDYLWARYGILTGADTLFAILTALCIVFMHRANIKRLLNGTESKVSFKKKGGRT